VDGDTIFCLATGTVAAPPGADQALVLADLVEAAAAEVVARAIAEGVREGGRPARG
jgi:L-aminopeptidase/D-esterase-like protein